MCNWAITSEDGWFYCVNKGCNQRTQDRALRISCTSPTVKEKLLGDYTKQLLTSMGITKESFQTIKVKFGLAPTCSCDTRQEWLNKVHKWFNSLGQ